MTDNEKKEASGASFAPPTESAERSSSEICSICYNEIKIETGKALLSCKHCFHLKCISVWLSENNSCPCCRHAVSKDYEDLRNTDELNERIEIDDLNERIFLDESEIENESEDEEENNRGGAIMITLPGLRVLAQYYCEFCIRFESREEQLQAKSSCEKISQDMFDRFCSGSIAAVHHNVQTNTPSPHFSHCFMHFSQTNMFFLGFFQKSEILVNSFWDLWERLRLRQDSVFQNDPNRNWDFIRGVIIDHRIILSSPQTSFLNFIIDPYTENRLNQILVSTSLFSNIGVAEEIIGV